MRKYLFQKAKALLDNTEIIGETEHSILARSGKFDVVLKYQNHQMIFLCSCKQGALSGKLCSHVIATLTKLTNESEMPFFERKEKRQKIK